MYSIILPIKFSRERARARLNIKKDKSMAINSRFENIYIYIYTKSNEDREFCLAYESAFIYFYGHIGRLTSFLFRFYDIVREHIKWHAASLIFYLLTISSRRIATKYLQILIFFFFLIINSCFFSFSEK